MKLKTILLFLYSSTPLICDTFSLTTDYTDNFSTDERERKRETHTQRETENLESRAYILRNKGQNCLN